MVCADRPTIISYQFQLRRNDIISSVVGAPLASIFASIDKLYKPAPPRRIPYLLKLIKNQ